MATDQLINKAQGDAIISGLTAIKNAINDQPVPTQIEDVVADAFDVGVAYVPGDYCIYENKLYVCDAAHHGAWDGNDFTLTTVGAVLESLNNDLNKQMLDGNYVYLHTSIAYNSSYTAPKDGLYFFSLNASSDGDAVIYEDSNRQKPIIFTRSANAMSIPLKKGKTVYTRNVSTTSYALLGYINFE